MNIFQRFMLLCAVISQGAFIAIAQEAKPASTNRVAPGAVSGQQPPGTRAGRDGKVVAIDKTAKTIAIAPLEGATSTDGDASNPKVYIVARETLIIKNGKLAKLDEAVVGEPVRYVPKKTKDGKDYVTLLRFGPEPPRKQPKSQ